MADDEPTEPSKSPVLPPTRTMDDAIRLLEDHDRQRQRELRGVIEQGHTSDLSAQPAEAVLDRLEAKYRRMTNRSRA